MKVVDNSETSLLPVKVQTGETSSINTTEPLSAGSTHTAHSEQPVPAHEAEQEDPISAFFAVGVVINIVMITVYFIWAFRQWNKKGVGDE